MGRVSKGERCSVIGCDEPAVRSLSADKVTKAGLKIGNVRRAYLCKMHYKEYKRRTRKERKLEMWRLRG